jgi:hypothetical protein
MEIPFYVHIKKYKKYKEFIVHNLPLKIAHVHAGSNKIYNVVF